MSTLDLFSSITVHGLVSRKGAPSTPFTLHRAPSFPAALCMGTLKGPGAVAPDMQSRQLPLHRRNLEIKVECRNELGYGRTGSVFPVQTLGVNGPNSQSVHLPELCVKVIAPTLCRCAARELWFYEQLEELQGTAIARCYGLFLAEVTGLKVVPWPSGPTSFWDDFEAGRDDVLSDDPEGGHILSEFRYDRFESKTNSPWNSWKPSPSKPYLAVIVMERLGRPVTEKDCSSPPIRNDLRRVISHLRPHLVLHRELRAAHVVRALHSGDFCASHGVFHQWRLIDFDRSVKLVDHPESYDWIGLETRDSQFNDKTFFNRII